MVARRLIGAAAVLLAAVGHPGVAKPSVKAAPVDWSRTLVATPEGGIRMGKPNARIKLVEYGSLVCPHCRHFAQTGVAPLIRQYVHPGQVSYEFRPLILSGLLPIVCPVADGSGVTGIAIFDASPADVELIMSRDPGVKAGVFTYDVHPTRSFPGSNLP